MIDLKAFRRDWSRRQKELRALCKSGAEVKARALFLAQHAVLHNQEVSEKEVWSYPDLIFDGLEAEDFRFIPRGEDHSLIWLLWHISRIEDITMNILVADGEQIYHQAGWKENLASPVDHCGNAAPDQDILAISNALDPEVLQGYRNAVGRKTRVIVQETPLSSWNDRVQSGRLDRLITEGAVLPQADGLLAYWGKRKIFELFLMPPTRHLMSHLNEAYRLKEKMLRSA